MEIRNPIILKTRETCVQNSRHLSSQENSQEVTTLFDYLFLVSIMVMVICHLSAHRHLKALAIYKTIAIKKIYTHICGS